MSTRFEWPILAEMQRPYRGLGWWRSARRPFSVATPPFPLAPFGWRWLKQPDRFAAVCLPLWLYWPIVAWRYRWEPVAWLERIGFARAPYDACYYREMRPSAPLWLRRVAWCFLHDADTAPDFVAIERAAHARRRAEQREAIRALLHARRLA